MKQSKAERRRKTVPTEQGHFYFYGELPGEVGLKAGWVEADQMPVKAD